MQLKLKKELALREYVQGALTPLEEFQVRALQVQKRKQQLSGVIVTYLSPYNGYGQCFIVWAVKLRIDGTYALWPSPDACGDHTDASPGTT